MDCEVSNRRAQLKGRKLAESFVLDIEDCVGWRCSSWDRELVFWVEDCVGWLMQSLVISDARCVMGADSCLIFKSWLRLTT